MKLGKPLGNQLNENLRVKLKVPIKCKVLNQIDNRLRGQFWVRFDDLIYVQLSGRLWSPLLDNIIKEEINDD